MAWFTKKEASKECLHGNEEGSCPRCVIGNSDEEGELNPYVALDSVFVQTCVSQLPRELNDAMREHGKKIVIAGGFVRDTMLNQQYKDVDVFCYTKTLANSTHNKVGELIGQTVISHNDSVTAHAFGPCQISWKFAFASPAELLDQFDYSICRAAIWYNKTAKKWDGIAWHTWQHDIFAKKLVFLDRVPEIKAIARLLSFISQGYRIDPEGIARVIASSVCQIPSFAKTLSPDTIAEEMAKALIEIKNDVPEVESSPFKSPPQRDYSWGDS